MGKLDAEGLQDAIGEINASILQVRHYKNEHPELKVGFYEGNVGSLLNAYREGDLSFDECTERLIPRAAVRDALAELREKLQPGLFWTEGTHARAMADFDATMTALGLGAREESE